MKKYFILSDIHGFYSIMMSTLTKKKFDINNPNHIIIVCGDLLDRGPETRKVVDFFHDLLLKNRAILIRGNHEDLFESLINRGYPYNIDYHNGTLQTYIDLIDHDFDGNIDNNYYDKWKYLLNHMVDYYETKHHVFVHGWIPVPFTEDSNWDWRNSDKDAWDKARWYNGMKQAYIGFLDPLGKTIVCGHYHASYGNARKRLKNNHITQEDEFKKMSDFKPFFDQGIIAIDACTAYSNMMNCLVFSERKI